MQLKHLKKNIHQFSSQGRKFCFQLDHHNTVGGNTGHKDLYRDYHTSRFDRHIHKLEYLQLFDQNMCLDIVGHTFWYHYSHSFL